MYKLRWLGIFEEEKIGIKNATPAQIVQKMLDKKWQLDSDDKDMIVMQHDFEYKLKGTYYKILSSMVVEGKDNVNTAMAITVGLPLAIGCKLILERKITSTGVLVPTLASIYEPILNELAEYGIVFKETKKEMKEPNGL